MQSSVTLYCQVTIIVNNVTSISDGSLSKCLLVGQVITLRMSQRWQVSIIIVTSVQACEASLRCRPSAAEEGGDGCSVSTGHFFGRRAERFLWGHGDTKWSDLWKRSSCSDNQGCENSSSNKCTTSKRTMYQMFINQLVSTVLTCS